MTYVAMIMLQIRVFGEYTPNLGIGTQAKKLFGESGDAFVNNQKRLDSCISQCVLIRLCVDYRPCDSERLRYRRPCAYEVYLLLICCRNDLTNCVDCGNNCC